MDKPTSNFLRDVGVLLFILLLMMALYLDYSSSGILLAGGLAITVWVAADVLLFRKS
ncbi:hypothetical protein J2P12_01110 [Candidatus Bathyarchaeota archaeon]|nr:hypothetical protein [Candidatus Bathyarchaeota archaeon]